VPDLIIRGGTVIDGTRAPGVRADIAVDGDRISAVGQLDDARATVEIDATGRVVAPGLIDVHNHSDGWLVRESNFAAKTTQGFTTEVLMADGIGYAPVNAHVAREWLFYLRSLDGLRLLDYTGWETFEEFMQTIDGHTAQNACSHLPYANMRSIARGFGSGVVDDFQMREIQRQIVIGMEAGAVGVSTGLDYIVQHHSPTDELVEALSAMAPYGGLYVTHVRYKKGLLPALEESVEIARRAGVPLHISHLKGQSPGQVEEVLDYLDTTARHQVDLTFDVYPYQPGSTMLNYLLPYEVWEDGPLAALSKLNDPVVQARFEDGLEAYRLPLDRLRIAWVQSRENAHWQGRTVVEYIDESGLSAAEALLNLLIEERLAVLLVFDEGDDALVEPFLQHDLFMLGSDGIYFPDGCVHPRAYGSSGRLLGPLVRDRRLFSLEDAVYKASAHAADRFRLESRGVIKTGNFADLIVFDADRITDRATYDDPNQRTEGVEVVLVNGVPVVEGGNPLDLTSPPGRFLRAAFSADDP
jgi:N-acyl-D-amino-acid deacylase